jgi:hypothetical protein
MAKRRTIWHVLFVELLKERAPSNIEITAEVTLSTEPQRADVLLFRRRASTGQRRRGARILRRLWKLLPTWTLVEFKSPSRPLRRGDLARLLALTAQYHSMQHARITSRTELALLLVVTTLTPTMDVELASMGWTRTTLGGGYYQLSCPQYAGWLIVVTEVCEAEQDDLLDIVGQRRMQTDRSEHWLLDHTVLSDREREMAKLEGYRQTLEKALKKLPVELRLKGIKPKERVEGLKAKERLQGLSAKERVEGLTSTEQIMVLPDKVLRGLTPEFIAELPLKVRAEIRRRLAKH